MRSEPKTSSPILETIARIELELAAKIDRLAEDGASTIQREMRAWCVFAGVSAASLTILATLIFTMF